MPANPPVKQCWSGPRVRPRTGGLLRGDVKRPSRASNASDVQKNEDGSVDVYFGPEPPLGKEPNWVPTKPGPGFEYIFRLYAPTEALFEKTWKLPDVGERELIVSQSPGRSPHSDTSSKTEESSQRSDHARNTVDPMGSRPIHFRSHHRLRTLHA